MKLCMNELIKHQQSLRSILNVRGNMDEMDNMDEVFFNEQLLDEMEYNAPPEIVKAATIATQNLFLDKSKHFYNSAYYNAMNWRKSKKTQSLSENMLMAYFGELSNKVKPSTLWSRYSMLKSTLIMKTNVNIANYKKLLVFMKRNLKGFRSKKSKIFRSQQIQKFLIDAPDDKYLATKVNTSSIIQRDYILWYLYIITYHL